MIPQRAELALYLLIALALVVGAIVNAVVGLE